MPDNIGAMFYYGETPWHRKGKNVPEPATAAEALVAGRLDREVDLIPIQTAEQTPSPISRRMAVVRTDRKPGDPSRVLGVVHPGFLPLQNQRGVEVFDQLIGHGQAVYHTGGYLGRGEVIWLLAKLPKDIKVHGDDVVEPYMLFTNSHDGSIAVDFRLTAIRVVCQNTLSLALKRSQQNTVFKRAHQGTFNNLAAEAEVFFRFCLDATEELDRGFNEMSRFFFTHDHFKQYVERLVPLPKRPARVEESQFVRHNYDLRLKKVQEVREGMAKIYTTGAQNGISLQPAEPSLWGALNAVTAYVDHFERLKPDADRYAYSLFGTGATLKHMAFRLALTYLPSEYQQATLFE